MPQLGWRWNAELEARNKSLAAALDELSRSSLNVDERQRKLEAMLREVASNLGTAQKTRGDRMNHSLPAARGGNDSELRPSVPTATSKSPDEAADDVYRGERADACVSAAERELEAAMVRDQIGTANDRAETAERELVRERRLRAHAERSAARRLQRVAIDCAAARWRLLCAGISLRVKGRLLVRDDSREAISRAVSVMLGGVGGLGGGALQTAPALSTILSPSRATGEGGGWTFEAWVASLPLAPLIAQTLRRRMDGAVTSDVSPSAFLAALVDGTHDGRSHRGSPAVASEALTAIFDEIFNEGHLGGALAELVCTHAEALARQMRRRNRRPRMARASARRVPPEPREGAHNPPVPSEPVPAGPETLSTNPAMGKFVDSVVPPGQDVDSGVDGTRFELVYGTLKDFARGLTALVGPPVPVHDQRAAMGAEHCDRDDSSIAFVVGNYGTTTFAKAEWCFVSEPNAMGLVRAGIDEWPREATLCAPDATPEESAAADHRRRTPRPLADFEAQRTALSERLGHLAGMCFDRSELIAARLYTGPMFVKYNGVLRGVSEGAPPFFQTRLKELCVGNLYTATLHVINGALVSLSQLTVAHKVYRGVAGGRLPIAFNEPDDFGCRGGVEFGFMSTTDNRQVAVEYAAGDAGLLIEIEQGLTARGADLSWLSQYPFECEFTFPPLTMLEVVGHRVEGTISICLTRPTISRASEAEALEVCAAHAPEAAETMVSGPAASPLAAAEESNEHVAGAGAHADALPAARTFGPGAAGAGVEAIAVRKAAPSTMEAASAEEDAARLALIEQAIHWTEEAKVVLAEESLAPTTRSALSAPALHARLQRLAR